MMLEERNGNVYSQRVANEIQIKLNNCPFTPHNFKLAYDLEGYENEKSNKLVEKDKVQTRLNMENYNSRMFFEAMKLKNISRQGHAKKTNNESTCSPQFQPTGKFYHLSFEPMRIEDYKEFDENKLQSGDDAIKVPNKHKISPTCDHLNNNNNKTNDNNNLTSHSNNSSPVHLPAKRPLIVGNEEKTLVLANVSASKFAKRGGSRKLPMIPCQAPFSRLSSTMPDLIATTKIPSLAEEIMAAYNQEKKNFKGHSFGLPQCLNLDICSASHNDNDASQVSIEDLGIPEMIDPIKKYSDLYLNESYVRSIICFLSTCSPDFKCPLVGDDIDHSNNGAHLEENPPEVNKAAETKEVFPSQPNLNEESDVPGVYHDADLPNSNSQRSRRPSKNIESVAEELKRDSSAVSRNSDGQSLGSHEGGSETGSASFPPGFSDIELYLDECDATHRGCHKFLPRHPEEIAVEIGDSLFVEKEHDDLWCEGINLRTKKRGIFPTAYATDLSLLGNVKYKYFVNFLGSIEVGQHTGHDVLCKAIKKLASAHNKMPKATTILSCLEIEEVGIKISERKKKTPTSRILSTIGKLSLLKNLQENEHVFLLKNITFCGILPNNDKYVGFITKHPVCMKFACHVFQAPNSGRPIVEAIGNSLSKFHQEFLSVAYPVEDIYFE